MTGVRLLDGLELEPWSQRAFFKDMLAARQEGIERGWLKDEPGRISATAQGRRHADSLAALFF